MRGLERARPRSARGSWWALLLRSRLFGQNVRTPQEAIQPVRHFQGGQDCRCCAVKGMMFMYTYLRVPFPISEGSICSPLYLCPPAGRCGGGAGGRALALQPGDGFECYQTVSCQKLLSLQPANPLWHAVRYPFGELSLATSPILCRYMVLSCFATFTAHRWGFCLRYH